jgi:hypothetical protein
VLDRGSLAIDKQPLQELRIGLRIVRPHPQGAAQAVDANDPAKCDQTPALELIRGRHSAWTIFIGADAPG